MTAPGAARLLTLTAIVVGLAVAVGLTGGPRGTTGRPLLAPGLDPAAVTAVVIEVGEAPPITVELAADGPRVVAPVPGPADETVVRDLISALATARADRVARGAGAWRAAGLDRPAVIVRLVGAGGTTLEVRRGDAVPASGQVWLGVGDRALLAPAWVGDALARELPALRRRRPFPPVAITGVELHGVDDRGARLDLVLAGAPPRRRDDGGGTRVAAAAMARLEAALAALVLDVLVDGDRGTPRLTARVLGGVAVAELDVHGPCPGAPEHVLVDGSAGVGCVAAAAIGELVAAARALGGDEGRLLAPLAAGDEVTAVVGAAGAAEVTLARRGAGWTLAVGGGPGATAADEPAAADDALVQALLAALARPGRPVSPPAGAASATWTVRLAGGAVERWRWFRRDGELIVRRDDEAHALAVEPAVAAAVARLGPALRELTVLALDASAIATLGARGLAPATLARGVLVGEWRVVTPPGARAAAPAVAALVELLAHVHGQAWLDAGALGRPRRTLTVTLDAAPVAGATPRTHVLAVGGARPGGGCAVAVDDHLPLELPAAACATLLAPLTAP